MKLLAPKYIDWGVHFLWAAVLVAFPITSFPYLPFMGTNTQVRPLSLIPATLLFILLSFRSIQEKRLIFWSKSLLPLIIFAMAAMLSSAIGALYAPIDMFQSGYQGRVLRAWITLAVGLLFIVISVAMNRDDDDLRFTLKWLYAGFVIQLAWSLVQLFGFYVPNGQLSNAINGLVYKVQSIFVVASTAPHQRISGLTLEPSWLAAEILTAYLPWAFASLLKGYRWNRHAWLAPAICASSILLLVFTYSRSGLLTTAAAILLTFLVAGWGRVRQAWTWLIKPFQKTGIKIIRRTLDLVVRTVLLLAILAGAAGGFYVLSQNSYFSQIWKSQQTNLIAYFVDIYAGPRLAYAWAGWTIFEQHPWSGVGLGAAGLYIRDALPAWSHFNIPEITMLLSPENISYPNAKNLYIRLLSETGIVGFWLFISFFLLVFSKILSLLRSPRKDQSFIGVAGLFSLLTILALGLSQDSFAMPTIWIPLGVFIGLAESRL
jgi:O-antigen ligase